MLTSMKNLLLIVFTLLIFTNCTNNDHQNLVGITEVADEELLSEAETSLLHKPGAFVRSSNNPSNTFQESNTKVIRSGNLTMQIEDFEVFSNALKLILENQKAYTTTSNQNDTDNRFEATYTIRVPADNFDQLFQEIQKLAKKVEFQQINQRDVTEQFIDLTARLKNRKSLEQRYLQLLKQTKNINEIIRIEQQLNNIRSEIESQEGRLKYLNSQVDLSTIYLTVYFKKPYTYEPGDRQSFGQRFLKSLEDGWSRLVNGALWFISIWPIWLIILFLFTYWKLKKNKG